MHRTYRVPQTFAYGTIPIATEDAAEIAPVLGQATVPVSEVRDRRRSIVWVGAGAAWLRVPQRIVYAESRPIQRAAVHVQPASALYASREEPCVLRTQA